jgi:hypothetical protein
MKLSLRALWILFLVISSLWVFGTFFPVLYSLFSPSADFEEIIRALEMRAASPPQAAADIEAAVAEFGMLQRAWQIGYRIQVKASIQHKEKTTQASYIAWFSVKRKPILLILERYEKDNLLQGYLIGEGEPTSLIRPILPPLLAFAFSLYMVRRRKPKQLP